MFLLFPPIIAPYPLSLPPASLPYPAPLSLPLSPTPVPFPVPAPVLVPVPLSVPPPCKNNNALLSSFERGRSGRGDRVVGEVHLPLDAAQLIVPEAPSFHRNNAIASGGSPSYRLSGEWDLQGVVGLPLRVGARVGVEVVVRGPPSSTSAAGRLKKRRESVGWYAR